MLMIKILYITNLTNMKAILMKTIKITLIMMMKRLLYYLLKRTNLKEKLNLIEI